MTTNVSQGKLVQAAIQGLRTIGEAAKAGGREIFAYTTAEIQDIVNQTRNRPHEDHNQGLHGFSRRAFSTQDPASPTSITRTEIKVNPTIPAAPAGKPIECRDSFLALCLFGPTREIRDLARQVRNENQILANQPPAMETANA